MSKPDHIDPSCIAYDDVLTMSTHTPGPWHVGAMGYKHYQILTDNDAPLIIAVVHDPASAHLIATAPDLLDLARNIAGMDERYIVDGPFTPVLNAVREWKAQARAAIAKAGMQSRG